MQAYIKMINTYLKEHPPAMQCPNMETILDILYCCYHQQVGKDSQEVKRSFRELDGILGKLSLAEYEQVHGTACDLCVAHRKAGFLEGIQVGFRLYNELYIK